jgi:adenylate kinase
MAPFMLVGYNGLVGDCPPTFFHKPVSRGSTPMINIALFGPPGAGKGTQAKALIEAFGLHYISTGDILRKEMAAGTKLGMDAKHIVDSGGLVTDEIIVQIIENTITSDPGAKGFLFDGFPRNYAQCQILEGLLGKLSTSLKCLISLELDEKECIKRLVNRGATSGRSDDNDAAIRNRFREYQEKTLPVMQFYKDKGMYRAVKGDGTIEQVREDIAAVMKEEFGEQ